MCLQMPCRFNWLKSCNSLLVRAGDVLAYHAYENDGWAVGLILLMLLTGDMDFLGFEAWSFHYPGKLEQMVKDATGEAILPVLLTRQPYMFQHNAAGGNPKVVLASVLHQEWPQPRPVFLRLSKAPILPRQLHPCQCSGWCKLPGSSLLEQAKGRHGHAGSPVGD